MDFDFSDDQEQLRDAVRKWVDKGYDFSDPGTGKTRSHAEIFRDRKGRKRMLVVCPKTLMFAAWGADIERFTPELTVSYATADQREAAFAMNTDVVIINTDGGLGVRGIVNINGGETL